MDFDFSQVNKTSTIYKTDLVEVYKAIYNGTSICIKAINTDRTRIDKAVQEAEVIRNLRHSSIIEILWHGTGDDDQYIIAQELLEHDLNKEIKRRKQENCPWTNEELINHLADLVDALAHMQERRISHRDIKPQNILVRSDGKLKLADFGSAKAFYGKYTMTIAGTPAYLSPEVRSAYKLYENGENEGTVSHNPYKSDVFSLGLTFLYMLTFEDIINCADERVLQMRILKLPDCLLKNFLGYMLSYDLGQRPDFTMLKNWLISSGILKNLDIVLHQYTSCIKTSKENLLSAANGCCYRISVYVENSKLEYFMKFHMEFFRTHTGPGDLNHMEYAEHLLCANRLYNDIWKIRNFCCICQYGFPDNFCQNCNLCMHFSCMQYQDVDSRYSIDRFLKCTENCPGIQYKRIAQKCFKCLCPTDTSLYNDICHHVHCDNCLRNSRNSECCLSCPFPLKIVNSRINS